MKWDKVLNIVKEIKTEYIKKVGKVDTYNLEHWIETLAAEKYDEFIAQLQITTFGTLVLLRYGQDEFYQGDWTNPDSILRHCRSLVIDLEKEEVVIYPFEKFFNMNELEETSIENIQKKIKKAKVFEVSNKMDGSMYAARYLKICGCNGCDCTLEQKIQHGKIITCTSRSLDEAESWRLKDANRMLFQNKNNLEMLVNNPNYTFVFEYISLADAHVIKYQKEEEGIYLIGITDMTTGRELNYSEILQIAKQYGVLSTITENLKLEQLVEFSKTMDADKKEGWVLNIDGFKVKIKCDDYVNLHRILGSLRSINVIIEAIADGKYDDFISKVPIAYRDGIEEKAKKIFDWIHERKKLIKETCDKGPKGSRKEFMIWADSLDKNIQGYVRSEYLGIPYNLLTNGPEGYRKQKDLIGLQIDDLEE